MKDLRENLLLFNLMLYNGILGISIGTINTIFNIHDKEILLNISYFGIIISLIILPFIINLLKKEIRSKK